MRYTDLRFTDLLTRDRQTHGCFQQLTASCLYGNLASMLYGRDAMWCITGSARTSWSEGIPRTSRCRRQRWTRNSRAAGKTSVYPPWRRTVWPEYGTSSHSLLYNILNYVIIGNSC